MQYYTYITANKRNGTLYIGMTNNLVKRIWEHKNHVSKGFTDSYDATKLMWYAIHTTAENAIRHEKRLKKYLRKWKLDLIEKENPDWIDLYDSISSP